MTQAPLVVVVYGTPAPQGSKRHVGGGRMVESSTRVAPWRAVVTRAAQLAAREAWSPTRDAPVTVHAVFTMARPASHYRTGRNAHLVRDSAPQWPATRPDLDKLVRSTLDALTDAAVLVDDSRVVSLVAVKCYPEGHLDALSNPGAVLTVWEG